MQTVVSCEDSGPLVLYGHSSKGAMLIIASRDLTGAIPSGRVLSELFPGKRQQ